MQRHVDQRARGVLDRLEALVEAARLPRRSIRSSGIGSPVLDMARVPLQHLRLEQPVLEELRRQLDEVAQHLRARQPLVGHLRQQAVQAVTELVEQRAHVVERQQRRLAGGPLAKLLLLTTIGRTSPSTRDC